MYMTDILQKALENEQRALSEYEGKQFLSQYGIPITREILARNAAEAVLAAREIGFPVAVKACGPELMHKTEAGAVFLNIKDEAGVTAAVEQIAAKVKYPVDGALVQEMVPGRRELVLGLHHEPQFGPCVMLGLGGVMTEVLNDTAFRIAPFDETEAADMAAELRTCAILKEFRGDAAVDRDTLCACLTALGKIGMEHDAVAEIDINPMIILPDGRIKAADALVVLTGGKDDKAD